MSALSSLSPKTEVKTSGIHGRGLFAAVCRGVITGQDWRKPELQSKYGDYMSWYLRRRIRGA